MYTLLDYQRELAFSEWIQNHGFLSGRETEDFKEITINCSVREEYFELPFDTGNFLRVRVQDHTRPRGITGHNIPYLKRSYFNLPKLRTTLKMEKTFDEEDDFSGPFITLWTQLEQEFKMRFYKNFIPANKEIIYAILNEISQNKHSFFVTAVEKDSKPTFGLINVVLFALEKALRFGNKKVMFLLSEILGPSYGSFFRKYSLYEPLEKISNVVRNLTLHDNIFISYDQYNTICRGLFQHSKIYEWCNSEKSSLFTEYLKVLPKSEEEINIEKLEKLARITKMRKKNFQGAEINIEHAEAELIQLKEELKYL